MSTETAKKTHTSMSLKQARRIVLASQGLLQKEAFGTGIQGVQQTINQLRYIQIDTISVVERAHHHVLSTRVPHYSPEMLHELQAKQKTVFEYWYHAAAYLPMEDYRFYRPTMEGLQKKKPVDKKLRKGILQRIKTEGPLSSKDFDAPKGKKNTGWWDWKPAKRAMEMMFFSGELMIAERKGFQKVYDLTENCLPDSINLTQPSDEARGYFYIRKMLANLGVARAKDICYARTMVKHSGLDVQSSINRCLENLVESAEVLSFSINDQIYYCLAKTLNESPKRVGRKHIRFLSPFDNLVINRDRLSDLFDFDYKLECYVPAAKRKFGYFVLPILFGGELIGRLDCKAERKSAVLIIHKLWLEKGVTINEKLVSALSLGLNEYKIQLGCNALDLSGIDNKILRRALQAS